MWRRLPRSLSWLREALISFGSGLCWDRNDKAICLLGLCVNFEISQMPEINHVH